MKSTQKYTKWYIHFIWREHGSKRTCIVLWRERKLVHPPWKTIWLYLTKLHTHNVLRGMVRSIQSGHRNKAHVF